MDGLFGDGLVDVLCCGGDSLEEDLRWGPRLGALVDLVEFEDGVTNGGVALFKIVEALSGGAFFFSTSVELVYLSPNIIFIAEILECHWSITGCLSPSDQ